MESHCAPDTFLSAIYAITHLLLTASLWNRHIIMAISYMRKLKYREVKWFDQEYKEAETEFDPK